MYTDSQGMQPHSTPRAMTAADIDHAVDEYAKSAQLAIEAGFDGVELHAANGYLIEQFLNANVNRRTDAYGGSIEGRNRFALEVARATAAAIGAHRVGIRLSPYGVFNSTGAFPDVEAQYLALTQQLSALGLQYVHLLDHSAMGAPRGACRAEVSASRCLPGFVHPGRRLRSRQRRNVRSRQVRPISSPSPARSSLIPTWWSACGPMRR